MRSLAALLALAGSSAFFPVSAQHAHHSMERLGTVSFAVECNAAAQEGVPPRHGALPFLRLAGGDRVLRRGPQQTPPVAWRTGAGHGDPRQSVRLAGEPGAEEARRGRGRPGRRARPPGLKSQREKRLRRGGPRVRARPRQARPPHALCRPTRGDGAGRSALPGRQGGDHPLGAGDLGQLRSRPTRHTPTSSRRRGCWSRSSRRSPTTRASRTT